MNTKNVVVIGLVGLVLLGLLGATAWVVTAYRAPLGPALEAPSPTAIPVEIQVDIVAGATQVPTAVPVAAQAEVCGETEAWNLLVLGSDAGDLRGPKGSDLTRILRVDFPNKKVTAFAFSRDLWVDTTGLGLTDPEINATQLGMVFYEARARASSADVQAAMLEATNVSARMLAVNFLVSSDHYLTVDLAQVPAMVDAVGGVPVDVPAAITDPWIGMTIPAGQQTMDGKTFVAYARVKPDSDFARIQRNNRLLEALRQKMLDPAMWTKIPGLYAQFNGVIATDLSPEQIEHLACLLKEVPQDSIVQDGVRQEWTTPGPLAGSLQWDRTLVLNRLKELGLTP